MKIAYKNIKFSILACSVLASMSFCVNAADISLKSESKRVANVAPVTAYTLDANYQSQAKAGDMLKGTSLRIGVSVASPLVSIIGGDSGIKGIEIDIINELKHRTGFDLANGRLEVMPFEVVQSELAKGNLDIAAGGIYITDERHKKYDLTAPTYNSHLVLVACKNSSVKSFSQLRGAKLAHEAGTTTTKFLPADVASSVTLLSTTTNFMSFFYVSRGKADALIVDEPLALDYIENWPDSNLVIYEHVPDSENSMALVLKKGTKASKVIQDTYVAMIKDGTVQKIIQRYIKTEPHSGYPSVEYKF